LANLAPPIPTDEYIEHVMAIIERGSHWERRLFVKKRMAAQYPRFFYKFFGVNLRDPSAMPKLRDVLVESRFWLADHRTFNDPFDLKAKLVFQGSREQKERRLKALVANQAQGADRKERRAILAKLMARSDAEWDSFIKGIFLARSGEIGVCSFSADSKPFPGQPEPDPEANAMTLAAGPRSTLMWAHYGRNHEGVCLQFETVLSPRVFTFAQRVQYSTEYPTLNYVALTFNDDIMVPLVRKSKDWQYENEWRLLHMAGARTQFPFEGAALRRLIFGCRAPVELHAAVSQLLDERTSKGLPSVKLYRAVQHPAEYKLGIWSVAERTSKRAQ
jgi:hypothetical protein